MPIPQMPNSDAPVAFGPVGDEPNVQLKMTPAWLRAFVALVNQATWPGASMIYKGAEPPPGWSLDTTPGLPALPSGKIWIVKD